MAQHARLKAYRDNIKDAYYFSESQAVKSLTPYLEFSADEIELHNTISQHFITSLRKQSHFQSVTDQWFQEYSFNDHEGMILMRLVEALLRVPDKQTALALLHDTYVKGNWQKHYAKGKPWLINLSAKLMGVSVQWIKLGLKRDADTLAKMISFITERSVLGIVHAGVNSFSQQFVFSETIHAALMRARPMLIKGDCFSFDMLGESARTEGDAEQYFQAYLQAISVAGDSMAAATLPVSAYAISIKLSALISKFEYVHKKEVFSKLIPRLEILLLAAKKRNIPVTIDAEHSDKLELSLDVFEYIISSGLLQGWDGFGVAVQAYQKRVLPVIDWLIEIARVFGCKLSIRLVKGAYWDSEIKQAQIDGLKSYPVFTHKVQTDCAYIAAARKISDNKDVLYGQFATHNAQSAAVVSALFQDHQDFEFQRLFGMGYELHHLLQQNHRTRVYAPVGGRQYLLAYLVRRILENGANSSFVHQLPDSDIDNKIIAQHPVVKLESLVVESVVLPQAIYSSRENSKGLNLCDAFQCQYVEDSIQNDGCFKNYHFSKKNYNGEKVVVNNPSNKYQCIGSYCCSNERDIERDIILCRAARYEWSGFRIEERAEKLNKLAVLVEEHRSDFLWLLCREAGKTVNDSITEIREAIDFCRYYSTCAEKECSQQQKPLGVVVCISPWNFPLAIFLGQVCAALVVGNTVIAKPAEQTSLIALLVVALMKQAGFPEHSIKLLLGPGRYVGHYIFSCFSPDGVLFTGSTATARYLQRQLLTSEKPFAPMIAETGGQNAMIVDSTALIEQVVDDVITSVFYSAGQRCSSIRLLYLQEEIADHCITMLVGAMQEMVVGNPELISSQIGPIIDEASQRKLMEHVEYLNGFAKLIFQCDLPRECCNGSFFPPSLFEIDHISQLRGEVFGPVLHVIKYKSDNIEQVITDINESGYGLTQGLHSRRNALADLVVNTSSAGNIYINRNTVGAVVESQPFGGRGLSGTGPKAGGPWYLKVLQWQDKLSEFNQCEHNVICHVRDGLDQGCLRALVRSYKPLKNSCLAKQVIDRIVMEISQCMKGLYDFDDKYIKKYVDIFLQQLSGYLNRPVRTGVCGENNEWLVTSRGNVLCFVLQAARFENNLLQIIAALITGNNVILAYDHYTKAFCFLVKQVLCKFGLESKKIVLVVADKPDQRKQLCMSSLIDVIAFSHHPSVQAVVVNAVLERNSSIVSFIDGVYKQDFVCRFLVEKTVTYNTSAAGGDVELLGKPI